MNEEKRMAGEYEIFQAIYVGPFEVVIGENKKAPAGEKYMCAFCESNELFASYYGGILSDDYVTILKFFGERISEQAEKLRNAITLSPDKGIDDSPITGDGLMPITSDDDLNGKVILIKPEVLRREYQRATHQYQFCTGGFGASPNSRGSAVFCTNLYSGKTSRFERWDVLAIVDETQLPDWAKDGLHQVKTKREEKEAR